MFFFECVDFFRRNNLNLRQTNKKKNTSQLSDLCICELKANSKFYLINL